MKEASQVGSKAFKRKIKNFYFLKINLYSAIYVLFLSDESLLIRFIFDAIIILLHYIE